MTEKGLKYLSDILLAISLIEDFTAGIPNYNSYNSDLKTQSAVERQLVIVGEALNQLRKSDPAIQIQNEHQIVAFRNRLVHAYDGLDNAIVWTILSKYLQPLRDEVQQLFMDQNS